jgi:hypothetical protein
VFQIFLVPISGECSTSLPIPSPSRGPVKENLRHGGICVQNSQPHEDFRGTLGDEVCVESGVYTVLRQYKGSRLNNQ